jgi:hypothetical protein
MNLYARLAQVARGLALLALLVLLASWLVYGWANANATLAQRIEPHDATMAQLLGEPGVIIGSPQRLIITDPQAFLPEDPTATMEYRLVNETYLKQNNIYPLQLQTVEFFRNIISVAAVLGGLLMLGLAAWFSGRVKPKLARA